MSYYLIRIGEGSKYTDIGRKNNFVAIGWDEVPDLRTIKNLDDLKKILTDKYQYSDAQIGNQAGQIYKFWSDMQDGDVAISPLGKGEYLVGKLGTYYFENQPQDGCPYRHRRKVEWNKDLILKEDMTTNLSYAVGGALTLFSLDKYANELASLISGRSYTPAEKPQRIRDVVLAGLMELNGKEFEEFIKHVLEIVGFSAETTQYVGDKGIDVNGILDAEGLADITLRVQVKRIKSSIGNKEVLALRGALSQGEHGCLITLSSFTAQATEEAQASGKIPIKLIDGEDLSALILKHFDDVDGQYIRRFGITKKKDFNIEDQFETVGSEEYENIDENEDIKKAEKPDWDTLVCAAKKDGFNMAFLGQKAWWAVTISKDRLPNIKYIAIYQIAPISAITYYGKVDRIERYEDTNKYKLFLKGNPIKFKKPIGLGEDVYQKPQGPKYAELSKIQSAKTLDDIWDKK